MPKFSLTVVLILYGLGLVMLTLLDVFSASPSVNPDGFGYRLTDSFRQTSLNNRVLVAPSFRLVPGESLTRLNGRIRQTFMLNRNVHAIAHGHSSVVPEGWVYLTLTNAAKTPTEVVLSMPQHRCSRATLFLERDNRLDSIATLLNDTPLANRFFLSYQHAFPIALSPGQRVGVLLRTNAYVGFHEFGLTLSSRRVFLDDALGDIIREWLVIFTCAIIGIISLLIGFTTPSPLMRTFGFTMIMVMLQVAFFYGYLGQLPYPRWTSFSSIIIGTSIKLLLDSSVQLFIYQAIKPAIREIRWYKPVMGTLVGIWLFCILLHALPPQFHPLFNVPVNRIMTSAALINLVWIGYFSLLAYRRAGIVYLGLFFLMLIGDVVVKQLSDLIQGNELSLLKYPAQHPLLLIAMLTYLTASQFRRELVTKQRLQKQVSTTRQQMDTLRREEIERIGRDLHDQVGNTLASALGYITSPQAQSDKPRELIRDAITELRFLSHNLVKDDDRPLTEKVETLVSRFNDFSLVKFIFQDYTEKAVDSLPRIQQQSIYGILQELLTNAVRHSGASVAYVQFFCDGQTMEIAVEDDGVGFDLTTNASGNLQAMIDATGVEQVWVAGGTYKPTGTPAATGTDRSASFVMKNNVAIYGGFAGNETSLANRPAVNPVTGTPSSTTLSGDIGTPNDNSDNSYHVIANNDNSLNNTAVLDGVVITGGNASGMSPNFAGGGIYNVSSSPTLTNCSLQANSATNGAGISNTESNPRLTNCSLQSNSAANSGGGIYNTGSSPTLTNCSLLSNAAQKGGGIANLDGSSPALTNCSLQTNSATTGGGGGIYNRDDSNPTLINCSLQSNTSANKGGGIYNNGSSPTLTNCSLLGNSATYGGGIFIKTGSNPTLANCVLWNNGGSNTIYKDGTSTLTATYSLFDDTVTGYNTDGAGNKTTTTSPFASANSVTLASSSPAINAGSNGAYEKGPETDLAGNPRIFPTNGTIDMGAVESQATPVMNSPFAITGATTVSCTVLSAGQRQLQFNPQYSGTNGQPISFSVTNEMLPTTNPGPYTLNLYTDNPRITLVAKQGNTTAQYVYEWLAACTGNPGNPGNPPANTAPTVANPIGNQSATVNQWYSFTIPTNTFTDKETPNNLAISVSGLPSDLSFANGTISGSPSAAGQSTITVTATDPGGLSASTSFVLTVSGTTTPGNNGAFTISGVSTQKCETLSPGQRRVTFTPQYTGQTADPISFSVTNEMLPTTAPGPYTLNLYTDNPRIKLVAKQGSTTAQYTYEWLAVCSSGARLGAEPTADLRVTVLGNPVVGESVEVDVSGAAGALRLQVVDGQGHTISQTSLDAPGTTVRTTLGIGQGGAGLYLLQVSTPTQRRVVKLIKH